jgi:hypothetical protein
MALCRPTTSISRLPPSELWLGAMGVSLQDERDRQFVSVERIVKIGKGHHQHLDFVQELTEPGRGTAPCQLQHLR